MTIGQRAAQAIKQAVNYGKVAPELKRLGITSTNYCRWRDGKADPQAYWLQQLAFAGYDTHWILTGQRQYPVEDIDFDICEYEEDL